MIREIVSPSKGFNPHNFFKNMNNTELTLDQLSEVAGGAAFMKLGDIKGEYRQIVHPQFKKFNLWTNRSASSFRRFLGTYNLAAQEQQP